MIPMMIDEDDEDDYTIEIEKDGKSEGDTQGRKPPQDDDDGDDENVCTVERE